MNPTLTDILVKHKATFYPLISIKKTESILPLNLSITNTEITESIIASTQLFSTYILKTLLASNATFGIGGYKEHRNLYKKSAAFMGSNPRTIHLGVDIWGAVGTPVFAPIGGMVHSYAFNQTDGNYGVTIILQHNLDTTAFYTLYGHLSLKDLEHLRVGKFITRGEVIGHFGPLTENGNWPPHLHFQIIEDIGNSEGDYSGVCAITDVAKYIKNCPDAGLMINV